MPYIVVCGKGVSMKKYIVMVREGQREYFTSEYTGIEHDNKYSAILEACAAREEFKNDPYSDVYIREEEVIK